MNRGVNHVPGFACKPSARVVHSIAELTLLGRRVMNLTANSSASCKNPNPVILSGAAFEAAESKDLHRYGSANLAKQGVA